MNKKSIKFRFVPILYVTNDDYYPDFGYEYGYENKPYGWNKNVTDHIKQRPKPSKQELETLVEFSPDPRSRSCLSPSSEYLCEPIIWSVKIGEGLFKVKLFLGDPQSEFLSDLTVNNKIFTNGLSVSKNTMEIVEQIVESNKGFISIRASCKENCDDSMNRLNAVEITPYQIVDDSDGDNSEKSNEEASTCGQAFTKGRCEAGPDVLHCLFNDPGVHAASFCNVDKVLKAIPSNYVCKDQVGLFKCVKLSYNNQDECRTYCPVQCNSEVCVKVSLN